MATHHPTTTQLRRGQSLLFSRQARKITPGRSGPGNEIRLGCSTAKLDGPSPSVPFRKEREGGEKAALNSVSLLMSVEWTCGKCVRICFRTVLVVEDNTLVKNSGRVRADRVA